MEKNISLLREVYWNNLITFYVDSRAYQAEAGMTFYDWAMSEYYDESCYLAIALSCNPDLRNDIINANVSPGDSIAIFSRSGIPITPYIHTDTIIQPISYMLDVSEFTKIE